MSKAKIKEETVCFVIEGEFLTNLTRQLWADEGKPEKAFGILESAFPKMRKSLMFSILIGEKKLIGDSSKGCELVADDTETSPCGNSLSLESVVVKFKKKIKADEEWIRIVARDNIKEMEIEERRREKLSKDKDYLDNYVKSQEIIKEREAKREKPKPPKARHIIDNDHGWLSPNGKFYPCGYGEHILLADHLGFEERELEKKQWMKLQRGDCFLPENEKPSQKQRDMIFDWFTARKKSLPWWFEEE